MPPEYYFARAKTELFAQNYEFVFDCSFSDLTGHEVVHDGGGMEGGQAVRVRHRHRGCRRVHRWRPHPHGER